MTLHWVVQDNLFDEQGAVDLVTTLTRLRLPHDVVKVVPFSHELIPDISPAEPVMVMGSVALCKIAAERGWTPGSFSNSGHDFRCWRSRYAGHILNADAEVSRFTDVTPFWKEFFIRPCDDDKSFKGRVVQWSQFADWRKQVLALGAESAFDPNTNVCYASVKAILREYRFFIIDGTIVTASLYKLGDRVVYRDDIDPDAMVFAQSMIGRWCPARGFALDIAQVEDGYRVLEVNCLNSAGFYAADVQKLVHAIESMTF